MTSSEYAETARTSPTRSRERVSYDRPAVHAVLDEAAVCHVGFVVDGHPVVLPQLHVRVGEQLYLHASSGGRMMRMLQAGPVPVCATVTLVDGLVLARSAFHHSINYRSVVVHGLAAPVVDPKEKTAVLAALVDGVVPGRSAGSRAPDRRELAATTVLRLPLVEVSLKQRSGPPVDDEEDLGLPYWAGVVPVTVRSTDPVPAPNLDPTVPLPEHVRRAATTSRRVA